MKPTTYALFVCLAALEKTPQDILDGFDKQYANAPYSHYDRSEFEYFIGTNHGKNYLSKAEVAQMLEAYRSDTGLAGAFWHEENAETLGLTDIN